MSTTDALLEALLGRQRPLESPEVRASRIAQQRAARLQRMFDEMGAWGHEQEAGRVRRDALGRGFGSRFG